MSVLLQNRTISMILMVPDVEVVGQSSPTIENLQRSDMDQVNSTFKLDQLSDTDSSLSMPVYQGSILRIETHRDDQNTSDLIIRVPNFQRSMRPANETDIKDQARIKRRAPLCPIRNDVNPRNNLDLSSTNPIHQSEHSNLNESRATNSSRLSTGLRSLGRAFTHSCKVKRSSSIGEIIFPSALPDVEVMTQKLGVSPSSNKPVKHPHSTSAMPKLLTPKVLFIKRKPSQTKRKQTSSSSSSSTVMDTQTHLEENRTNVTPTIRATHYADVDKKNSPRVTSFLQRFIEDNENPNQDASMIAEDDIKEQQNEAIRLSYEVDKQFTAISQLIADIPMSSVDGDSLSTHRYSTISVMAPEIHTSFTDHEPEDRSPLDRTSIGLSDDLTDKSSPAVIHKYFPKIDRPFRVQTSILQPDICVIRMGTNDLTTAMDRPLPGERFFPEQADGTSSAEANIDPEVTDQNHIELGWYDPVQPGDELFSECYEVTYQIESKNQHAKEPSPVPISMKITLDPLEYKSLASQLPVTTQNEYEQIERDSHTYSNDQQSEIRDNLFEHKANRIKSRSADDLSRTSHDRTSPYQTESTSVSSSLDTFSRHCTLRRSNSCSSFGISVGTDFKTQREHFIHQVEKSSPGEQAGLKENDRILCINGTPVIQEEYTVVLQLIKNGLQSDTLDFDVIANESYEEFKAHIDQLYR